MPLPFIFKIHRFTELPSTNTYARQQAEAGDPEGSVYIAERQTHGRGQFDRKWESPDGKNLTFSILLRPPVSPAHAPIITQIVCRSISHVLEKKYAIKSQIKRPNDILVEGKKICGILVESSSASLKSVESVIIGIGLNVNEAPQGVQPMPIAMKDITGKTLDLNELLRHLLDQLNLDLAELYSSTAKGKN